MIDVMRGMGYHAPFRFGPSGSVLLAIPASLPALFLSLFAPILLQRYFHRPGAGPCVKRESRASLVVKFTCPPVHC